MNSLSCLILLLFSSLLHIGASITCYTCSSSDPDDINYDPDCATSGYNGHTEHDVHKFTCFTDVYVEGPDAGAVDRHFDSEIHEDDQCFLMGEGSIFWRCYCVTDLCNSNNCEHCHGETTPGRITDTTPASASTTIVTDHSDNTMRPTPPLEGLSCYSCVDCKSVDDSTDIVTDENFVTCVTAFTGPESLVMRMGHHDSYQDGECVHGDGGVFCYCISNLCNDGDYSKN